MNQNQQRFRKRTALSVLIMIVLMTMFGLVSVSNAFGQEQNVKEITESEAGIAKFGLLAAAIAFGFGAIGAGIAIAHVGSAAMGAIGEKPEIASQALIFIALAEGLVVFGFITALMILGKF
jgi:V/A-type H+/Na+-transporting ATPase subunit K